MRLAESAHSPRDFSIPSFFLFFSFLPSCRCVIRVRDGAGIISFVRFTSWRRRRFHKIETDAHARALVIYFRERRAGGMTHVLFAFVEPGTTWNDFLACIFLPRDCQPLRLHRFAQSRVYNPVSAGWPRVSRALHFEVWTETWTVRWQTQHILVYTNSSLCRTP